MIPARPRTDGARPRVGGHAHARPTGEGPRDHLPEASVADAEADEAGDGAAGLLSDLADALLRILGEGLVQEAVLLEEAVEATLDDLGDRLLGLALVTSGLLGDATLVGDLVLGDLVAREVGGGERGDVHRDVTSHL